MAKKFNFKLITPDGTIFDDDIELVLMPTENGEIGVMAGHLPIVTVLVPGPLEIAKEKDGPRKLLATGGGFAKILSGGVKVFAQTAEFADSIDEKRAIEAKQRAAETMGEKVDEIMFADAKALLERNVARIKTIERKKRRSHHQ